MILVTGATGNVGGHLVPLLCGSGAPVRGLVRSPEKAEALRGYDCEVAIGSFEDAESLDEAMRGVDRVFLLSPAGEGQVEAETAVVEAAERSGAGAHVVKLAVLGTSADSPVRMYRNHAAAVSRLERSGLPTTVLEANYFHQNLLLQAAPLQEQDALLLPGDDTPVSAVDARDVAAVAAHVLTSDGHAGATYRVTGPEPITRAQTAERLSALTGREIRYTSVEPTRAREGYIELGLPGWLADGLLEMYASHGRGEAAEVTDEVNKATGRDARSLDDFLADHRAAFA